MSSNQTTNGKLTNKDLTQIYGRYIHLNGMNDYPCLLYTSAASRKVM